MWLSIDDDHTSLPFLRWYADSWKPSPPGCEAITSLPVNAGGFGVSAPSHLVQSTLPVEDCRTSIEHENVLYASSSSSTTAEVGPGSTRAWRDQSRSPVSALSAYIELEPKPPPTKILPPAYATETSCARSGSCA